MTNTKLETIKFHNQQLIVLNYQGKPYVAIKPICENIGLDWEAQRQRIKRNEILNSTAFMIKVVAKDGKNRELLCLPLGYLNGWLFGIELSRVNPEIKPLLKQYQLECFDVLYNHFMPKVAQQFPNINLEHQFRYMTTIQEYYCRVFNLYYDCLADFLKKNSPHIHYNFYTALDKIHINVNLSLNSLRRELNAKSKIGN